MAVLLAASLRHALGNSVTLIAAVPQTDLDGSLLNSLTLEALSELCVSTVPISNPFGARYPIANKIAAMAAMGHTAGLLLDSDLLCLTPPPLGDLSSVDVAAKPADILTFQPSDERGWRGLYAAYGLDSPNRRIFTTVSNDISFPYFNSGVIYSRDAKSLGDAWMSICGQCDVDDTVKNKWPWLDQIALPLAIQKLRHTFVAFSERWNYPAHIRVLPRQAQEMPYFAHYHTPAVLAREPSLIRAVDGLAAHCKPLRQLMAAHVEWGILTLPQTKDFAAPAPGPNVIITGIPRSGTSLLCRLLDDQSDNVVINEPQEAHYHTNTNYYWEHISCVYADLRRDIWHKRGVDNKTENGVVVTDTAINNLQHRITPTVSTPGFVLGTKNTLMYMTRLPSLRAVLKDMHVIACIRDPRAAISSWKHTFKHLEMADVRGLFARGAGGHTCRESTRIDELSLVSDVRLRRALLWRHLALIIEAHKEWLMVVRYEDLIGEPKAYVGRLLDILSPSRPVEDIVLSVSVLHKSRPVILDAEEERMIADICGPVAEKFGYVL